MILSLIPVTNDVSLMMMMMMRDVLCADSSGRWSQTNMVLTRLVLTTATPTSSWKESTSTTTKPLVCHCQLHILFVCVFLCIRYIVSVCYYSFNFQFFFCALSNRLMVQWLAFYSERSVRDWIASLFKPVYKQESWLLPTERASAVKNRMNGLSCGEKIMTIRSPFWYNTSVW